MKKGIFIMSIIMSPWLSSATHIVGGEFELLHVRDFQYRLNMVLYFDLIHGGTGPNIKDDNVFVIIYRKRDNAYMDFVIIPLINEIVLNNVQPSCAIDELKTSRLLYSTLFTLPANTFNDPGGYYVVWQRCCRNENIANIFCEKPSPLNKDPDNYAGQTFYLEFPPVTKNETPFVDSTPKLTIPTNEYACVGQPYYINFYGSDDDGDSLAYSLVTPLNTTTDDAIPFLGPYAAPYKVVKWRPPYSLNNIMAGAPDLAISKTGLLTVTPTISGLFVFALKVEEYRNKIKIGEMRREFQLLVDKKCSPANRPQIIGKLLSDATYNYNNQNPLTVKFNQTTDDQRCINVRVSDPDSEKSYNQFTENISITAIAFNFTNANLSSILPTNTTATLRNGSTVDFKICFPACPFINGQAKLGIIAMDDACSVPLMDTLRVNVTVQSSLSSETVISTNLVMGSPQKIGGITKEIYQTLQFKITGTSSLENNTVTLTGQGVDFNYADYGLTLTPTRATGRGTITQDFSWTVPCHPFDLSIKDTYTFRFIATGSEIQCSTISNDTVYVAVKIIPPNNQAPTLNITNRNNLMKTTNTNEFEMLIGDTIDLLLTATDADLTPQKDNLKIERLIRAGDPAGIDFRTTQGQSPLESVFRWKPDCSIFSNDKVVQDFTFKFEVDDDRCMAAKKNTIDLKIRVKDIEVGNELFRPPNFFSPNGDSFNPTFTMEVDDLETNRKINLISQDNCTSQFAGVRIYNRWGKEVFHSSDRNFKWDGGNQPAGVYYYFINYTKKEYRGSVTLVY